MSWATERALADPQEVIAKLQRQLDERTAERDALRRDLADVREQQIATAEVLQVINSSPGNLAPVFDAMLEKAMRLCEIAFGALFTRDGEYFHAVAARGLPPALAEYLRHSFAVPPGSTFDELVAGVSVVQIPDVGADDRPAGDTRRALVELGGARTGLAVALCKDDGFLGAFWFYRQEVRPFTDKQIALLQNFAAQAVIAMENARLLTETREALEQQIATAGVLRVINSSPGDLAPVFDAILEKAHGLCGIALGALQLYENGKFRAVAARGVSGALTELLRQPFDPPPGSPPSRLLEGEPVVQISDMADMAELARQRPDDSRSQALAEYGSGTVLFVPLRRDADFLGYIAAFRQEVRPFSDKEIALLQNFAAQAVIAIENARLLTETREALEQQTATSNVLKVISRSTFDLQPVLQTVLDTAVRLCRAGPSEIFQLEDDGYRFAVGQGMTPEYEALERMVVIHPDPGTLVGRTVLERRTVHVLDAWTDPLYSQKDEAHIGNFHTMLGVPLLRQSEVVGVIALSRRVVEPFSEREIQLVTTFADQAVIAIENTRLLTELRESLEQQQAIAEVLQVINSSPGDLDPVFQAMLQKAHTLCEASFGALMTYDGERFHAVAHQGTPAPFREFLGSGIRPGPGDPFGRMVEGAALSHIHDLSEVAARYPGESLPRAAVNLGGIRTFLVVPLRKDSALLGIITAYRQEVRPFSEKQIALLQNFAAQAVIAMENARLLTETREALEQQTATAEVLQVINSSPGDLAPVFDTMLDKALTLCGAALGYMLSCDGDIFRRVASRGFSSALEEALPPPGPTPGSLAERFVRGEKIIRATNLMEAEAYRVGAPAARALVDVGGVRSYVAIALRKGDRLLGVIAIYRLEVRPFSDKQITLLQNFAQQAVIAMENARLINEIRQRQAELRVTFDNMGDGVVMFDGELRLAAWNRNFQEMLDLSDAALAQRPSYAEYLRILAERGEFGSDNIEGELSRRLAETDQELRFERTRPNGRIIEVRRNAVPSGGFVLIYSDITERKAAEARLRAARDTAEGALRELRAAQANLIHAEKMASLGQLTAGIAHEIKNPLNFVNNFAGLSVELLDELKEVAAPAVTSLGDEERAEIDELVATISGNLEKIAAHGKRADGIVSSMLEHSRGSSGERRCVDLNALVDEALNLAYHGGRAQNQSFNITLERNYAAAIAPIELVPQDITRVCLNLFSNGFYAATKRQREASDTNCKPTLKVSTRDLGKAVEIRVRDNGIGIPPEIKDKLFQPFFTTKPTGEGTGLGLSISYDIVTQQHGGTIEVDSEVGAFTEFTVRLPR